MARKHMPPPASSSFSESLGEDSEADSFDELQLDNELMALLRITCYLWAEAEELILEVTHDKLGVSYDKDIQLKFETEATYEDLSSILEQKLEQLKWPQRQQLNSWR